MTYSLYLRLQVGYIFAIYGYRMKYVLMLPLILSFVFSAASVSASESYDPTEGYDNWMNIPNQAANTEEVSYSLADKVQALEIAEKMFKMDLLRSRSEIERVLNCLSEEPQLHYGLFVSSSSVPMYNAVTTCEEYIQSTAQEVKKNFRKMKVSLSLMRSANETGAYRVNPKFDQSVYLFMNPAPEHPFKGVSQVPELTVDEVKSAVEVYANVFNQTKLDWLLKNGFSASDLENEDLDLSFSQRRSLNTAISEAWQKAKQVAKEQYFSVLSEMPYLVFLPNYFSKDWNNIDRAIWESAVKKVEEVNCQILVEHFATEKVKKDYAQANMRWTTSISGKYSTRVPGDLEKELCKKPYGSSERQQVMEKVYKLSPGFASLLSKALRYEKAAANEAVSLEETLGLIVETKDGDFAEDLAVMKEIMSGDSSSENETSVILKEVEQEVIQETPFMLTKRYEELKKYAWYLPVLNRFVAEESMIKYNGVFQQLNSDVSWDEIKSDLTKVAVIVGAMVACNLSDKIPGVSKFSSPIVKALICDVGIGLTGDVYFYNLESKRYNGRAYRNYFASIDKQSTLMDLEQLQDAELSMLIETYAFYFSAGVTVKGLYTILKNSGKFKNLVRKGLTDEQ